MTEQILGKLQTTSSRLLAMAVGLVGESDKVKQHMKLTDADFLALLTGEREMTWAELDLLTTLLIHEQGSMIARNRDLVELIRLRSSSRR